MIRFLLIVSLLGSQQLFAEEISRDDVPGLMEECQRQRQINIEPLRQEAIEDCVSRGRGDREYCERYNRNFGERTSHGSQRGLFWHLPECEKAVAAERFFRMNPGRDAYTPP